MNNKLNFFKNKKFLLILGGIISLILLVIVSIFSIKYYGEYKNNKRLERIEKLLTNFQVQRDKCTNIFSTDEEKLFLDSEKKSLQEFQDKKELCNQQFNLSHKSLDAYSCYEIIAQPKQKLLSRYLRLDNYENTQKYCMNSFLKVDISAGKLFDELNGFKTQIIFDFSHNFYRDIGVVNGENFIENRVEAKKRFLSFLETSQNISVGLDDITLYPKKAILWLDLQAQESYSFGVKTFDVNADLLKNNKKYYSGEARIDYPSDAPNLDQKNNLPNIKRETFELTLPENKFLGLLIKDPVTLYPDTNQPTFSVVDYDSKIPEISAKICRIPNESYAKIEVMNDQNNNLFFQKGIDEVEVLDCYTKIVSLEKNEDNKFNTTQFTFSQEIGEVARSGLYYVTFENPENRYFNKRYQRPLFFGIVDSHITMKVSKNGQAFFFVNDLKGNPLAQQNIRIAVNNFRAFDTNNSWNKKDRTLNSPLETQIFQPAQLLGETNQDGVLEVNLTDFIQDGYQKTFGDWYADNFQGMFDSFMVTSSSETNLSYSNSRFNAGIAPWNFGYTIDAGGYYSNDENTTSQVNLKSYIPDQKDFLTHIFPERRLYLPGETAYIKAIIRDAKNLEIPTQTQAQIKIFNPKDQEIYSTGALLNDFGSISIAYDFDQEAELGLYRAKVYIAEKYLGETGMNVEVFQKPKFKNDVILETIGLDEGFVEILETKDENVSGWNSQKYLGEFQIKAKVLSQYYNGRMLQNADFEYKVYKQRYYDNSYWNDCYYGCYWEPGKEFYTQGTGSLDINGQADFLIDIGFDSRYDDYKYIVEVSVEDTNGDIISGTNSVIAYLPEKYKKYNWNTQLFLQADSKFIKAGEKVELSGGLNVGNWSKSYDDSGIIVVKKKDYSVEYLEDIRGKIPKNTTKETIIDILPFNDSLFKKKDGKLYLDYKIEETGEYVFEYGAIGLEYPLSQIFDTVENKQEIIQDISEIFIKNKSEEIIYDFQSRDIIITLDDIIVGKRNYFSVLAYGDTSAKNPENHDNKLQVLSQKVSYKPGETAQILVRLPFENTKILWTVEKQGVVEYEYIDVPGNIFFKEILVDQTFEPNAYIGVTMIDTRENVAPEYKVGYTEIVVDKSEKVSNVSIQTDKKTYIPRENVEINLEVTHKNNNPIPSEITLMVVDDSLISLLGNVDLNILEKIYKKLPFQIQTQLSSVAMFQNFYFARKGIVGGSGLGSFKGGDSAISSRNIFKNTAFYKADIITDENGKAQINFELPDNVTNFRIMAVAQSKDNYFGNSQEFISVRKNILIEEKMPLISRTKDEIVVGANIFNLTNNKQDLEVSFESQGVEVENKTQKITLLSDEKQFVTWRIKNISNPQTLSYSITAQGENASVSDKIEKTIPVYSSPVLYTRERKTKKISAGGIYEDEFQLDKNIDKQNSFVELTFSNNKLYGLEKALQTLLVYPYGCIEQSVSSTYPNVVAQKLSHLFSSDLDEVKFQNNIQAGLERIFSMQNADGGFSYWHGENQSNLTITPYVLRSLLDMQEMGVEIESYKINQIITYLQNNIEKIKDNTQKTEVFWALTQAGKYVNLNIDTSKFNRHELLAYTYALYYQDAEEFEEKISQNIIKIESLLQEDNSIYYWNKLTDIALFTQLIIDVDFDETVIENKIDELYSYDFESFYYSTNTKNAAFRAFVKYIEYTGTQKSNSFGFSLGKIQNRDEIFTESGTKNSMIKKKYTLEEMLYDDGEIDLKVANLWGDDMYVDFVYHKVPKDKQDIQSYSNGVEIQRNHFLVNDETKLAACTKKWYPNDEIPNECETVFSPVENNQYEKNKVYKSEITITFEEDLPRRDVVIEEFLASGFEIIQSNFKTQSTDLAQAERSNSWQWSYTQNLPDRAMAHAKNMYGKELVYEFYFRPKYEGNFTLPPVSTYLMYQPEVRAHTKFSNVEVK